jgi:hypothetical protein
MRLFSIQIPCRIVCKKDIYMITLLVIVVALGGAAFAGAKYGTKVEAAVAADYAKVKAELAALKAKV